MRNCFTDDTAFLLGVMRNALGTSAFDDVSLQALGVHDAMEKAGASPEEIQEMMAMMLNTAPGGVSNEFLQNVRNAMSAGGNNYCSEISQDFHGNQTPKRS